MKQFDRRCLAIIPLACALLSAVPLRAQNYPLTPGTRWTFHLRKEPGPGVHFDGEDGRVAKNNVVETTVIAHVGGIEQIGEELTRALKPCARTSWQTLTG